MPAPRFTFASNATATPPSSSSATRASASRPTCFPHIFELFTQADAARVYAPGGMGIGLSLAERLVSLHSGTIVAESEGVGRGSSFTLRLPLAEAASTLARPVSSHETAGRTRRRVLVVDDNIDVADTHAMLLAEKGCEVRTAYLGAAAVQEAERFRPELVLLDIGLPDVSGYEVCQQLRAAPWGGGIAIIAVTGWGQDPIAPAAPLPASTSIW